jgi:hypothetical protein
MLHDKLLLADTKAADTHPLPAAMAQPQLSRGLLEIMRKINEAFERSSKNIDAIEKRGFWANLTTSDREDILTLARGQNDVNLLMLELMQRVVAINIMGHAYLAAVIDDFSRSVKNGWSDDNGRFHTLSDTGRKFADEATRIFMIILGGSEAIQAAIASQADAILSLEVRIERYEKAVQSSDALMTNVKLIATQTRSQLNEVHIALKKSRGRNAKTAACLGAVVAACAIGYVVLNFFGP